MRKVQVLYLVCLLSPMAFLFGYMAGAPRRVEAPRLDFGGIDTRHLRTDTRYAEGDGASILIDESLRLTPNRDFVR